MAIRHEREALMLDVKHSMVRPGHADICCLVVKSNELRVRRRSYAGKRNI